MEGFPCTFCNVYGSNIICGQSVNNITHSVVDFLVLFFFHVFIVDLQTTAQCIPPAVSESVGMCVYKSPNSYFPSVYSILFRDHIFV